MDSSDNNVKEPTRRSKKVKNLEKEVELILSQDESDDDVILNKDEEILPKTPSRNDIHMKEIFTPRASQAVLQELMQTPRRSCRRSIKPTQDYDDIVSKSCNRPTRSAKKDFVINEEEEQEDLENVQDPTPAQPRWTPAKVGRGSRKRGRKSRRNTKVKNAKHEEEEQRDNLDEMKANRAIHVEDNKEEGINMENRKGDEFVSMEERQQKDNLDQMEENKVVNLEDSKEDEHINLEDHKEDDVVNMEDIKESEVVNMEENIYEALENVEDDKEEDVEETENLVEKLEKTELVDDVKTKIEEKYTTKSTKICVENEEILQESNKIEKYKNILVQNEIQLASEEGARDSLLEFMKIEDQLKNLQDQNESIHLIQEDSEDVNELPLKTGEDELCLKFEENDEQKLIEVDDEKENPSERNKFTKNQEDSFGCYLKSKEINMADLGLNPLKDDDQEDSEIAESQESEEMPSLIICDDDDEEVGVPNQEGNKLNETFEANDSVLFIEESTKLTQDNMETLKMSDDEGGNGDTPKKAPRIVLTNTELQNQTLLATPNPFTNPKHQATTQKLSTPIQLTTPKQSAKAAYRFPTPYRSRKIFNFNQEAKKVTENNASNNFITNPWMSTLEPKDIVLRGIRKRSLSVCIDGKEEKRQKPSAGPLAKLKQERIVSFHSPANQTTIIDDLDMIIAKSLKKQKLLDNASSNNFVTTRRKRSISFDDTLMSSSMLVSRLPRPVPPQHTPSKSKTISSTKPLSRTKLPNFAAIHEKHFNQMENLIDHVSRKQERSKTLINSASKIRPASAQKNISIIKKGNIIKKMDLGVSQVKSLNVTANTIKTATTNTAINKKMDLGVSQVKSLNVTANTIKTATTNTAINKSRENKQIIQTGAIPKRIPAPQQQIRKYLKPTQTSNVATTRTNNTTLPTSTTLKAKPNFNLSTSTNLNKSHIMSNEDKMANRLQRHMDLFKGRVPATRAAGVDSRKNDAVIRGVRSNRRFDLQMQHRKNLEN